MYELNWDVKLPALAFLDLEGRHISGSGSYLRQVLAPNDDDASGTR